MLLEDTQREPTGELPPMRKQNEGFAAPTLVASSVMLAAPVVGKFVLLTLLGANDTPAKLMAAVAQERV